MQFGSRVPGPDASASASGFDHDLWKVLAKNWRDGEWGVIKIFIFIDVCHNLKGLFFADGIPVWIAPEPEDAREP